MWAGTLLTCLCWLLATSAFSQQSETTFNENSSSTASLRRDRPFCDGCGESKVDATRVVGGKPASEGEYPWMAYLNLTTGFCGGSLIDRKHVLTAAHCLVGMSPSQTTVLLGTINKIRTPVGSLTLNVKKFFIHKKFNALSFANDIALVKLRSAITFTNRIKPVCMGFNKDIPFGGKAVATGWGVRRFGANKSPNKLQEVTLDVISKRQCKALAGARPKLFICALTENKDTCQGDSGGPLIAQLSSGQWVQVGIVSHGDGCAFENSPGVYTRVPQYLGWITARIRSGRC